MKKILTLTFVHVGNQVLLGMKKRGFGSGRWNGFGGKVVEGETVESAAKRELYEEAGITADNLQHHGNIDFTFQDDGLNLEVHVFKAGEFRGTIRETDEMKPEWFAMENMPYDGMWADDQYWLPNVLAGEKIKAAFHFDNPQNQTILKQSIETYV